MIWNHPIELTIARLRTTLPQGLRIKLMSRPDSPRWVKQWEILDDKDYTCAVLILKNDYQEEFIFSDPTYDKIKEKATGLEKLIIDTYQLCKTPPTTLDELENQKIDYDLQVAEHEAKIQEANKTIEESSIKLKELRGSFAKFGLIQKVLAEIEKEKRLILESKQAKPVFLNKPQYEHEYRVVRITPKRIYLRAVGSGGAETIVNRDGSNNSWFMKGYGLDIEATIARFKEAEPDKKVR